MTLQVENIPSAKISLAPATSWASTFWNVFNILGLSFWNPRDVNLTHIISEAKDAPSTLVVVNPLHEAQLPLAEELDVPSHFVVLDVILAQMFWLENTLLEFGRELWQFVSKAPPRSRK